MCTVENGEGVQVLYVEEDGTYRIDEAALRRVSQHEAARGLPVAVVSVAGATRGGKSFLLDFFLRYLRAPEAARRTGAWIGADDEPLTGFAWRGGCERETQGIIIWSEPIIITIGSNGRSEKVAVVLMDTQGTFDTTSTVRDSSTIFAMSTLLSSVQIYNLSHNIKEDDLQYLQLFTEYGKLGRDEEVASPFQVLQFLVRDWSYAYEHPVGTEGGQELLDKRLEIRSEQAEELREIREHIRSAFESVRCFLLPHPGLTVATSPHFRGCLPDISSEFKDALMKLAPSLFAPDNISLKTVNGQNITFQDLAEYFMTYANIFNSDVLPTPTTVMQATSKASLEAALRTSREAYSSYMESRLRVPGSVRREAVSLAHGAALNAARTAYASRRTLAAPALAAARLDTLLQELDAMLPHYIATNNSKIHEAIASSKVAYEEAMSEQEMCLSSAALTARHEAQVAAARAAFNASRSGPPEEDVEDDDWRHLEMELEQLLPLHRERNMERIVAASAAARDAYETRMRSGMGVALCVHPAALRSLHTAAYDAALAAFLDKWTDDCTEREKHKSELIRYIQQAAYDFIRENDTNNERAVQETVDFYNTRMSKLFDGLGSLCLHPQDLAAEHKRAQDAAVTHFMEKRAPLPPTRTLQIDQYQKILINEELPKQLLNFEERNEALNKAAVKVAHDYYISIIAPHNITRHTLIMKEALDRFRARRRAGPAYDEDTHLEELKQKIQASYMWQKLKIAGNVGLEVAQGAIQVAAMASMMFALKRRI